MSLLQRLAQYLRPAAALDDRRWVVLDVESSGLDPKSDRLLAIAAIAVRTAGRWPRIVLAWTSPILTHGRMAPPRFGRCLTSVNVVNARLGSNILL